LETENTIKYINQILDINLSDIAIYSITEETILSFRKIQQINMNIISKDKKLSVVSGLRKFDSYVKLACTAGLLLFLCNAVLDTVKILSYNTKITNVNKIIGSIDKDLVSEIDVWNEIDNLNYNHNFDFKKALEEHVQDKQKKFLNVSMEIKDGNIIVNTITENQ
jgi:hypothetical protein